MNHVFVKRVLHVGRVLIRLEEPPGVGLVLGEEEARLHLGEGRLRSGTRWAEEGGTNLETETPQGRMFADQRAGARRADGRLDGAALVPAAPDPGVPEPEGRQEVESSVVRAAVRSRDPDQDIVRPGLGVFGKDVEIAAVIEDTAVGQLEFRVVAVAAAVLLHKPGIRKFALRVLVERLHVGVGRGGIEVKVGLLYVLPVISLGAGEAEEPFLQDGITAVPEG